MSWVEKMIEGMEVAARQGVDQEDLASHVFDSLASNNLNLDSNEELPYEWQ
jgi:hypothetical protein